MFPEIEWSCDELPEAAAATELSLRCDFVREQWMVSGPGQLVQVAKFLGHENFAPIRLKMFLPDELAFVEADEGGESCSCPAYLHDVSERLPEVCRVTFAITLAMLRQASSQGKQFPLTDRAAAMVMALAAGFGVDAIRSVDEMLLVEGAKLWRVELTANEIMIAGAWLKELV